jgi:hypothetical protein
MATLQIRVKPKSSRQGILQCKEGIWQVALASPPEEGRANRELLRLLAKALGIAPSGLELTSGAKSRNKTVLAPQLSDGEAEMLLARASVQ